MTALSFSSNYIHDNFHLVGGPHPFVFMAWLGGIDFFYQLSNRRQIFLNISTKTSDIGGFFNLLGYANQSMNVSSDLDFVADVNLVLSSGYPVFCSVEDGFTRHWFRIIRLSENQIITHQGGFSIRQFVARWKNRTLYSFPALNVIDGKNITTNALRTITERFLSTKKGPIYFLSKWQRDLYHSSQRRSWRVLLRDQLNYFDMASQVYARLLFNASREDFVSCLSHCGKFLGVSPDWGNSFRLAANHWKYLSEILITAERKPLSAAQKSIKDGTFTTRRKEILRRRFLLTDRIDDIEFRLHAINDTLSKIIHLERQGMENIRQQIPC